VTAQAFASLNGNAVAGFFLHAAESGPWWADVVLEHAAAGLAGAAELVINGTTLVGTIDPLRNGTHGEQRHCRVVAGRGGWAKLLERQGYHNDAQVKTRRVADDAARAAGETIGTFTPAKATFASNYAREAGAASIALDDAASGGIWWVGYDGLTHVSTARPTTTAPADAYEVQEYNPLTKVLTLGVTGLTVGVGSIISERLDAPETIRSFTLRMTGDKLTMQAVCGEPRTTNAIERLFTVIVERLIQRRLLGKWRYRVVSMGADGRVNVQAVAKSSGVPDLLTIEQWPGVAGAHAELTNGAIVAVEFLEGRRDLPAITGFAGKQSAAFVATRLSLGATDPNDAIEVAYKGATVKVLTPPAVFQGTINGLPAAGVVFWPSAFTLGTIEVGSPKVRVGVT
jgi:hypothetical protein